MLVVSRLKKSTDPTSIPDPRKGKKYWRKLRDYERKSNLQCGQQFKNFENIDFMSQNGSFH